MSKIYKDIVIFSFDLNLLIKEGYKVRKKGRTREVSNKVNFHRSCPFHKQLRNTMDNLINEIKKFTLVPS